MERKILCILTSVSTDPLPPRWTLVKHEKIFPKFLKIRTLNYNFL